MSNGSGRDSYIALNDGGFRPMHIAGSSKDTYFTSLRQYARNGNRTVSKRRDDFVESQNRLNPRFKREATLIHNYQHMMDKRLSVPKLQETVGHRTSTKKMKIFKNSSPDL